MLLKPQTKSNCDRQVCQTKSIEDCNHVSSSGYKTHQNNAWMNREVLNNGFFKTYEYLNTTFLKEVGLSFKAVLKMDNASSHPSAEKLQCDMIHTLFFPPNVTSLIQPMFFWNVYRKSMVGDCSNQSYIHMTIKALYWP